MKYAVVSTEKGKDLVTGFLGVLKASDVIVARKAAEVIHGKGKVRVLLESERQHLISPEFAARVKANERDEAMNATAKARYLAGPSPKHVLDAVEAVVKLSEGLVVQLAMRWLDEREYEDFADYEKRMKDFVAPLSEDGPVKVRVLKGTKTPFGFHFTVGDFAAVYAVQCTTRSYGWKRVS